MTEAPLTATELAEWRKVAAESDTTHGYVLRRMFATIATLTTRAEQAEARIGDAVRVITQLQQRAQLAEARVAELTAALEEYEDKATIYVELDKTSVMARVVTSTALKQLEEGFANAIAKGRAAMEGQR